MHLIVGLGNPGSEYAETRHNIGFLCIDELLRSLTTGSEKNEKKAITYRFDLGDHKLMLAKPQTYMNRSGDSVLALMQFYKIPRQQLLVIHDDIDLPFGQLRLQGARGHGGQNGIRHIHQVLGSNDYMRLKLGVGRPSHPGMDISQWVLSRFSSQEQPELDVFLQRASQAALSWLQKGPLRAMDEFNQKNQKKET